MKKKCFIYYSKTTKLEIFQSAISAAEPVHCLALVLDHSFTVLVLVGEWLVGILNDKLGRENENHIPLLKPPHQPKTQKQAAAAHTEVVPPAFGLHVLFALHGQLTLPLTNFNCRGGCGREHR
jgi:hypothetical protein